MKKLVILSVILFFTSFLFSIAFGNPSQQVSFRKSLSSMPLAFTENQGQWDEKVLFHSDAGLANVWITTDGVYYQLTRRISIEEVISVGFHHRIIHREPCH